MLLSYLTGVVYVTATSDLMFLKLYMFLNFIMTDCVLFSPHFILIFFFGCLSKNTQISVGLLTTCFVEFRVQKIKLHWFLENFSTSKIKHLKTEDSRCSLLAISDARDFIILLLFLLCHSRCLLAYLVFGVFQRRHYSHHLKAVLQRVRKSHSLPTYLTVITVHILASPELLPLR